MSDLYASPARSGRESAESSATRKTGKDRFLKHRYYKKSKSLCTLETNIDDVDGTGNEDNLKRVPSVHELRVTKSLQKLNVPDWFKQSSLSKSSSCLLKYGSNSTMNSFTFSPSLVSSPCASTAPPATNVVIKTRVVPPSTTRSLRCPGLLASKSSSSERKTPTAPVKLPSEKYREKEKQKSLMPIAIVPFAQIRAMFENKTKAERKTDGKEKEEKTDPLPAIAITLEDALEKKQTEGMNEVNISNTLPVVDRQSVVHSPLQALLKTNISEPKQKISTTVHVIDSKEPELQEVFAVPADTNSVFPASVGTVASSRVEQLETKSARLAQLEQQTTRDAKDVRHKDFKSHSPTKSMKTFFGLSKEKHTEAKQQNSSVESSLSGDAIYESEPKRRGVGALARRFDEGDARSGDNSGSTSNSPNGVDGSRNGQLPPAHEHRASDSHMGAKTLPPIMETQCQAHASPENHHKESFSRTHPVVSSKNGGYHRGDDKLAWTPVKSSGPRSVKETTV